MKCFVFPINKSESFGIPLLETGATHCPVVPLKVGAVPGLIKNNISRLLVNLNDEEDFKKNY